MSTPSSFVTVARNDLMMSLGTQVSHNLLHIACEQKRM